jgi:hypothetical protein
MEPLSEAICAKILDVPTKCTFTICYRHEVGVLTSRVSAEQGYKNRVVNANDLKEAIGLHLSLLNVLTSE